MERCRNEKGGGQDWPKIMHVPDLEVESTDVCSTPDLPKPRPSSAHWYSHISCCRGTLADKQPDQPSLILQSKTLSLIRNSKGLLPCEDNIYHWIASQTGVLTASREQSLFILPKTCSTGPSWVTSVDLPPPVCTAAERKDKDDGKSSLPQSLIAACRIMMALPPSKHHHDRPKSLPTIKGDKALGTIKGPHTVKEDQRKEASSSVEEARTSGNCSGPGNASLNNSHIHLNFWSLRMKMETMKPWLLKRKLKAEVEEGMEPTTCPINSNGNYKIVVYMATPVIMIDQSWYVDSGAKNHVTIEMNNLNLKTPYEAIVRDMIRLSVVSFPIAFDIPFGLPPAIDHFLELTQTPLSNIHTSPTLPHEFTTSSHPSKSLLAHAPIPCHLMITRAKSGIVKLKVCSTLVHPLSISPSPIEPMCIKKALVDPNWKILMEEEYKALMRNHTWNWYLINPNIM
ncbi:hypothetical protein CK203_057576 [Vitis vinifera]|uniref:Retrovirus-related Pol polyprotein from transposon RE2 n=1 Tax=Vitis vinifera TaxID=29760 RepID=A0A438GGX1_VITVI|nr:hypothetical protein CK203_057576 [Vitis vinifera]